MREIIDFGEEGGVKVVTALDAVILTISREKAQIVLDVPKTVEMLGIQLPFSRKPHDFTECSGFYSGVMITHTKPMTLSEYVSLVSNLDKPYEWLKNRGGIYQRALDPNDAAWVPQPKARNYRLCVEVVCPGMPTLYIDPSGTDYIRYMARLG